MALAHQNYIPSQLPLLYGVTTERRQQLVARMYKRLSNVQRNERLADCTWPGPRQAKLPHLISAQ
jgi:hypothetical protein